MTKLENTNLNPAYIIVAVVSVILAILVNMFVPEPQFKSVDAKIEHSLTSNQPERAKQIYADLIKKDSLNIDYHYGYINAHFQIPEKTKIGKTNYEYRNDDEIITSYKNLSFHIDHASRDLGLYGAGLFYSIKNNYEEAISNFVKVENQNLKYLNNSLGYSYIQIDNVTKGEECFKREIELKGNVEGAYANLVDMYYNKDRRAELNQLLNNTETKQYVSDAIKRKLFFKEKKIFMYLGTTFIIAFRNLNIYGFLGALLILGCWTMYLRKLDIYEPEKWKHILVTIGLGMIFTFGVFFLSDINNEIFNFKLNGDLINDFLYCTIGIGAFEELVKIIPVLLLLRYTKVINEPYDYILYASLSALGFAFMENLIYLSESSLDSIAARGLSAAIGHMFFSSIIGYGLMLNKFKRKKNTYLNFLFFFFLASLAHGFWDFWLINETAQVLNILTMLLLLSGVFIWNSFKNNALNQSTFFDIDKKHDSEKVARYLVVTLVGIFLYEYLAQSIRFGPTVGNKSIQTSIYSSIYLFVFLTGSLGKFKLMPGKWKKISYWQSSDDINMSNLIDEKLMLSPFSKHPLSSYYIPNNGTVMDRYVISNEPGWYLLKLDKVSTYNNYVNDHVLIRAQREENPITPGERNIVAVMLIPDMSILNQKKIERTLFKSIHWAVAT